MWVAVRESIVFVAHSSFLLKIEELSFQHILPHFRECWWDHVILDVICTNSVAITLGMLIVKFSSMKEYDWLGRRGKKFTEWEIWHWYFPSFQGVLIIVLEDDERETVTRDSLGLMGCS